MSDYSKGLRHGREDLAKMIAEELAADVTTDAEKLERIAWLVAERDDDGAALPVRRDGGDIPAAAPSSPHSVVTRERVAEVLHDRENVHTWRGGLCDDACGISYFAKVDAMLAAGVFRDEATVKAEVAKQIRQAAIDEAVDGKLNLTALMRIAAEAGGQS